MAVRRGLVSIQGQQTVGDPADFGDLISAYVIAEEHAAGDELNIELESDPAKDVRRILRSGPYVFGENITHNL